MILTALIIMVSGVLNKLLSFMFISEGLPADVESGIELIIQYLHDFDGFFPVIDLLYIVGYVAIFEVAVQMWRFIKFAINVIRGSGA